jgi:bifunctional DNase/RNase
VAVRFGAPVYIKSSVMEENAEAVC